MTFEKEILGFFEWLMKLIEKYGYWYLFKLVIFVVSVIITIVFVSKYFVGPCINENVKEAISQNSTENEQQSTEDHRVGMQMRGIITPKIAILLQKTLTDMGADRAFVIELHNGSNNTAGLPFIHCTMTYEENVKNIEPIGEDYQNLSLSRFNLPNYFHEHDLWFGEVDDFSEIDSKVASRMKSNGVTYLAIASIRNEENEIGYYGFTYCNGKQPKNTKEITEQMLRSAQVLSKLLDKDDKF